MINRSVVASAALSLVAIAVLGSPKGDRYGDFTMRYDGFNTEHPRPLRWEDLPREGSDVTSCFFKSRERIKTLLQRADQPAKFQENFPKIYIEEGAKKWWVDATGVVRHNGRDLALSDEDFHQLRILVVVGLPYNDVSIAQRLKNRTYKKPDQ